MEHNKAVDTFWKNFEYAWPKYYEILLGDVVLNLERILNLITMLAGELTKEIDFELTYGEINRIPLPGSKNIVELYISPRLLLKNIPLVEYMFECAPTLPNLNIIKYRAYNHKDDLISEIEFKLPTGPHTYKYGDFGCQWFSAVENDGDSMRPLINMVILVKENATNILSKRPITFVLPDGKEQIMEKWLPTNANVVDIFLVNIIGEYNLIHNVGYIEFMPEDDPLIAPGSEFHELYDLRGAFQTLNNIKQTPMCKICYRCSWQTTLFQCAKCKKILYCGQICQRFDYATHKTICYELTSDDCTLAQLNS
jgi:hypothetical protein